VSKDPRADWTAEQWRERATECEQVLSILAGTWPTKLLLGKTGDRVRAVIDSIVRPDA
jgi:hypothetical protein